MHIYITTNLINNKKYIGKETGNRKCYLGSGILLQHAIRKYGKHNFTKLTLEECSTHDMLVEREKYWIKFYNAVKSDQFYNISEGGNGGNSMSGLSEEARLEVIMRGAATRRNNHNHWNLSQETKDRISKARLGRIFTSKTDIISDQLIKDFLSGTTIKLLSAKYKIGTATIGKLLRRNKIYRYKANQLKYDSNK